MDTKIEIKQVSPVASVTKQTSKGLIHMISNERGEASAELAVGSPELVEGSDFARVSEVTGNEITSLFRAGGAGIHMDADDNLVIQVLKQLVTIVETISTKAKSETTLLEEDSYKSCVNYLLTALQSVILQASEFLINSDKFEIDAKEITFNAPIIRFGRNTSLGKLEGEGEDGKVDLNKADSPLTWGKFAVWWNGEVAPAFEVLNQLASKFNSHTHVTSIDAGSLIPPSDNGENISGYEGKISKSKSTKTLSKAKTVIIQ